MKKPPIAPIRRTCVAAIHALGFDWINLNSGHIKIARVLCNSKLYVNGPSPTEEITRRTANNIMREYAELNMPVSVVHHKKPSPPTNNKRKKNNTHHSKSKQKSQAFLTSWEWRTLRYEVLNKFGRRCMCCGATPDDGRTVIHVDHIKPRHKYPELSLVADNLQVLCGVCNQGKGAWDETDFRHCIEDENERLEREFQIGLADKATTYQ